MGAQIKWRAKNVMVGKNLNIIQIIIKLVHAKLDNNVKRDKYVLIIINWMKKGSLY